MLLSILLLPSCEPGSDNINPRKGERRTEQLLENTVNPERIAAQESLGKPPLPRNLTEGIEDECPVHHEKMKLREIPIIFENAAPAKLPLTAKFPFGAEKIISAGNALLPGEPLSARVYQCASCVTARRAAEEKQAAAPK